MGGVRGQAFDRIPGEARGCCITASMGTAKNCSLRDRVTCAGVGGTCMGLLPGRWVAKVIPMSGVGGGEVDAGGNGSCHIWEPDAAFGGSLEEAAPFNRSRSSMGGVGGQGFDGTPGVFRSRFFAASKAAKWMQIVADVGGTCRVRGLGSWVGMGVAGGGVVDGSAWTAFVVVLACIGVHMIFLGGDFGGVWTTVAFATCLSVPAAGTIGGVFTWMPFAITSRTISGVYVPAGQTKFGKDGSSEGFVSMMACGNRSGSGSMPMGCLTFRYGILIITNGKRLLLFLGQNLFSSIMRSSREMIIGHGFQARVVPVLSISRSSEIHSDCVSNWSPSDSTGIGVHGVQMGQWSHLVASNQSADTSSCSCWACRVLRIWVTFGVVMGRHDLSLRLLVLCLSV